MTIDGWNNDNRQIGELYNNQDMLVYLSSSPIARSDGWTGYYSDNGGIWQ